MCGIRSVVLRLTPERECFQPVLQNLANRVIHRFRECFVTGTSSEPPDEMTAEGLRPIRHGVEDSFIMNEADDDVRASLLVV